MILIKDVIMTGTNPILLHDDAKIGKFLTDHGIIANEILEEALSLQKDNPKRLIGEILVTLGAISKEDLIMAVEMFIVVTDSSVQHTHEWLDQDEIDHLITRMNSKQS